MHLLSVNVGKEQSIRNGKQSGITGIYKMPTDAPVQITPLGLEGDHVDDKKNHGGVDQAVYVFGADDYAWWSKMLGRDLAPGTFGDNLTISDLETAPIQIGDRFRVGEVLLEVTAARIPCVTLAARMDDSKFVKRFRAAERPGLYCRVIETGIVRAGDPVRLEPYQGETLTAIELFRLYYDNEADESEIRRALAAPIAIRARNDFEERLAALLEN
jgi:MOSC domain-containing protein YiiM